jgi:hypothetical protein
MKMKYLNIACLGTIALFAIVSCVDYIQPAFEVEKPESLAEKESLLSYDVLNSYVDRDVNPGFILGSGVSVGNYTDRGLVYSLISSNFDEVVAGYAMKHGAGVLDDGTLNLGAVADFIAAAEEAGLSIYGHTLCWHANQMQLT